MLVIEKNQKGYKEEAVEGEVQPVEPQPPTESSTGTQAAQEPQPETESSTGTQAVQEPQPETEPSTSTQAALELQPETESSTGTQAAQEPQPETESSTQAVPESQPETATLTQEQAEPVVVAQKEEPQTREQLKKEREEQAEKPVHGKNRVRVRLVPIWLRLVIIILLLVFSLTAGVIVGYGVIGSGKPLDALKQSTWTHIADLINKEK